MSSQSVHVLVEVYIIQLMFKRSAYDRKYSYDTFGLYKFT